MAKKVLLIEYEPRYLDRIRGHLAGKDFELVVAKDGDEGLDAYRAARPDLVLISSVLPKLRTPDVIKGMQSLGPTPPIVLMMSGYKGKNKRADAQRVGATSILEKPFTEDVFVAEVEAALSNRPAPDSSSTGAVPVLSDSGPLLSADDIFSDVLSGMDETPARVPVSSSPGTDPGIQKKLEQTLSGILPAPRKATMSGVPAPAPLPRSLVPAARVSTAVPPKPVERSSVDSSVDRMLTETLSGLKASRPVDKPAPKSVDLSIGLDKPQEKPQERERTERLQRQVEPAKPAPAPAVAPPKAEAARPTPAPAPPPKPPEKKTTMTGSSVPGGFGRYQLLEKIAAGGMAEVFKARMRGEEGFEKIVAIKRILPHMADNDDFITMFIDEAKLAAQLTHNNIIHIYDLGKVDAYHYIAMEYVEGKDLRSLLKLGQERGYPLPPELGLFIASKIANALDYAHRRLGMDGKELNLVHRDVSPQNILISFEGDIKLCDFGIAKATTKVSQTQTGALKGKLQYMSPEQAWGKKIDRRTDIFSLGIVLFEMLTGQRLFTGDTDLTILEQVRDARIAAPSTKNPDVPKRVDQIVLKALAKNAQDRYQNASEFEKELNAVLYSFQPTPGPADLAIYMHRLSESQPMVSDEAIDAAFANADMGPAPEPAKKGKGLVISKKEKAPEKPPAPEPERKPEMAARASIDVTAPALMVGPEGGRSRAGLFAGIGVAAVLLIGGVVFFAKRGSGPQPQPTPAPPPETTASPATSAPSSTGPAPTAAPVIDKAAFDAEVKRQLAEKEKARLEAAARQPTVVPGKTVPAAAPTAALSLRPGQPLQPPKGAEPTAAPAQPTPRPTEAPRPTPEPVKVAEANPPSAPEPEPNVPPPSNAPVRPGELVGPGEGVIEPKLIRLGNVTLPPQARKISRGSGQPLGAPTIMALITEDGTVSETRLLKPSGYKFVDEAATNALKGAKIEPATKNGVKVKMWKAFSIPIKP